MYIPYRRPDAYEVGVTVWDRGTVFDNISGVLTSKWEAYLQVGNLVQGGNKGLHFGAYDLWGDTPSTNPISIECNSI